MRSTNCNICEAVNIPLNHTVKVDGIVHCSNCFETNYADADKLQGRLLEKEIDPTICYSCDTDFGSIELNKIGSFPMCDDCEVKLQNKISPLWVKAFFAGIIIIVIVGFIWNWKYYEAYSSIQESKEYSEHGDYVNASISMEEASAQVPEIEDLKMAAVFARGLALMSQDKCAEALVMFNKCAEGRDTVNPIFIGLERAPIDPVLASMIVQAKIGATFNNKDYEGFLAATKELLSMDQSSSVVASVASAYACIYADKGKEDDKQNALLYLNKAKAMDDSTKEATDYYNMIEYRINSRKIIKRVDFIKQFPNGWKKN